MFETLNIPHTGSSQRRLPESTENDDTESLAGVLPLRQTVMRVGLGLLPITVAVGSSALAGKPNPTGLGDQLVDRRERDVRVGCVLGGGVGWERCQRRVAD